jgi:hypothetical protein
LLIALASTEFAGQSITRRSSRRISAPMSMSAAATTTCVVGSAAASKGAFCT